MPQFHLYVIHTASLVHRQSKLHGTIQTIRELASRSYEFRSILVLPPDVGTIAAKLQEYSDRIKYEATGFEDIDKMRTVLNVEELSNYEKHREVWRRIQKEVQSNTDICMVLEDDAIMIPEFAKNLQQFIANPCQDRWDFLAMSMSTPSKDMALISDQMRVMASKCAYVVRPSLVPTLLAETDTIRFNMRIQLSYIFLKNKHIRAFVPNMQYVMEGSKVGLYPSTVHPNNVLVFNQEFMDLYTMLVTSNLSEEKARNTYKKVEYIQNPDIMHIYGVILFKLGYVPEAASLLSSAIDVMQKQHGMLNSQSELLNNMINLHEHMQTDIDAYLIEPSKYDSILHQ